MIIQLNPPVYLETTKGSGWAHIYIWPGLETSAIWVVFLDNGEIWHVPNEQVRACKNFTAEREAPQKP
ncbi:MAG TPA: hypothetical protein VHE12_05880 [bacterium]|nr:hypothetical protein [bacterium]